MPDKSHSNQPRNAGGQSVKPSRSEKDTAAVNTMNLEIDRPAPERATEGAPKVEDKPQRAEDKAAVNLLHLKTDGEKRKGS